MTMSFVVMLGHVYYSGMRPVGPICVSGQDTLLKGCPVLIMYALFIVASSLCMRPDMVSSLISKSNPMA